jgi:hypothetical protein
MKRNEKGRGGHTCSDSIRAFRISSLLFEIAPSLFVSARYRTEVRDVGAHDGTDGESPKRSIEVKRREKGVQVEVEWKRTYWMVGLNPNP